MPDTHPESLEDKWDGWGQWDSCDDPRQRYGWKVRTAAASARYGAALNVPTFSLKSKPSCNTPDHGRII